MKFAWTAALLCFVLPPAQIGAPDLKLESKVPSIEFTLDDHNRIAFHNLSNRGVTDFQVNNAQDFGTRARPKIKPGATFYWPVAVETLSKVAVLQAALFDDRTFEGDIEVATELAAAQTGRHAEIEIIERIVRDSNGDDAAALSLIREEVRLNSHKPDPALLAEVQSAFPSLPVTDKHLFSVRQGMEYQRVQLAELLDQVDVSGKAGPKKLTLAQWLIIAKAKDP